MLIFFSKLFPQVSGKQQVEKHPWVVASLHKKSPKYLPHMRGLSHQTYPHSAWPKEAFLN